MPDLILIENSSMFSGYRYDDAAWILGLVFKNGKEFEYLDVGPEVVDEFKAAKSAGTFYNASIKGVFDSRDVTKVPEGESVKEQLRASVVDDTMISDEDIRLAHPNYKAEEDIVTAEEKATLEEPVRRQPQVDKLQKDWALVVVPVTAIATKEQYVEVSARLQKKKSIRDAVFGLLDPAREAIYRAYKSVQDRQKSILDPMDASIQADRSLLTTWDTQQREIAAAAQRKADAEARAKADEDQRKRTEELRLQAAQQQVESGDADGAEKTLFDEDIQAPPVPVYAPRVEVETPKIEGQSYRDNWSARVTDFNALVKDVAAGIECYEKTGNLGGHAPTSVLTVSQTNLNQMAKASKSMFSIPGAVAENNRILATRKSP